MKRDVFARLDKVAKPGAVLATNTSSLDVNAIAAATRRPEAVVGTHFFSPAHVMRLLEVVVGEATSTATLATAMELGLRLGKAPVPVGVCDGFVGNRMLYAYRRQADRLLLEGALPEQVDRALCDFGFRMGPFAVADLAGLDIGRAVRVRLAREAESRGEPPPPPNVADRLCESAAGWARRPAGGFTATSPATGPPAPIRRWPKSRAGVRRAGNRAPGGGDLRDHRALPLRARERGRPDPRRRDRRAGGRRGRGLDPRLRVSTGARAGPCTGRGARSD